MGQSAGQDDTRHSGLAFNALTYPEIPILFIWTLKALIVNRVYIAPLKKGGLT